MSAIDLLQPLLEGGVRRNNFFNGRLLSAEDLRAEQDATRAQLRDHGRAFGDGIAWGLCAELVAQGPADPTVRIRPGLAFNRLGDALRLQDGVEVRLVPQVVASEVLAGLFAACEQPRPMATLSAGGAWVLTAAPVSGYSEMALVSDPNATAIGRGSCGARFQVEGLSFRLARVPIDLAHGLVPQGMDTGGTLESALRARLNALMAATGAPARSQLRNLLAHACYGSGTLAGSFVQPWARYTDAAREVSNAPVWARWGALDAMRERGDLTDCDVPLALVVLDATGIRLLDLWSVRRKPIDAAAVDGWRVPAGGRRAAEGEAAFLQFQAQLEAVRTEASAPASLVARDWFDWLPAAGWLPLGTGGFDWKVFLGSHAPPAVTPVDAALLRGIVERSWHDDPIRLATDPPVPLRVFQVPGDNAVVFARSPHGQLRLVFTPAATSGASFTATVEPARGMQVKGTVIGGGSMLVGELAPGPATLTVASTDFQPVTRSVEPVGGRTIDVAVTLAPLQNGSLLVTTNNKATGANIGAQVDSVVATGPSPVNNLVVHGVRQGSGQWLVSGLLAGRYALSGTAAGFKAATLAATPQVPGSGRVEATLDFERLPTAPARPDNCVTVSALEPLKKYKQLRLCMVTVETVFESRAFSGQKPARKGAAGGGGTLFSVERRNKPRRGLEIGGDGELLYDEDQPPWADMVRIQPQPAAVSTWLGAWRSWLAAVFGDDTIGKTAPALFVDRAFRPLASEDSVRKTAPAYAVFGTLAIPVRIGIVELSTRGPLELREVTIKGLPRPIYEELIDHDIRTVNDLVWSWEQVIEDITGDPEHVVELTIAETMEQVAKINEGRSYYTGMDAETNRALVEAGLDTDEAIAKSGITKLTQAVGSEALAHRLQMQAKAIVAR